MVDLQKRNDVREEYKTGRRLHKRKKKKKKKGTAESRVQIRLKLRPHSAVWAMLHSYWSGVIEFGGKYGAQN